MKFFVDVFLPGTVLIYLRPSQL